MKTWNRNTIDLEKYENKSIVIHCDTEEKANDLLKYLDEQGIKWRGGLKLAENNYYGIYKEFTCYNYEEFGCLSFSPTDWYIDAKYNIVEWEIVDENQQGNNILNIKINWEDFINGEFVIHCKTDSQVNELSQWIYSNKDEEFTKEPLLCLAEGWNRYHNEVCYNYNLSEKKINFGTENTYLYKNYEAIEWDGKNLYEINGTIETDMDIDELNDKFIDFIESINGEFAGGIK